MTLVGVITHFLQGEPGWTRTLTSDGRRLMSYGVVIGVWEQGRVVLPGAGTSYSRTTSRHRGMLREMATARGVPYENR